MDEYAGTCFWISTAIALIVLPITISVFCRGDQIVRRPILQALLGPAVVAFALMGILTAWLFVIWLFTFLDFRAAVIGLSAGVFWTINCIAASALSLAIFWTALGMESMRIRRKLIVSALATIAVLAGLVFWHTMVRALFRDIP
ncbi:MAG: hypothetical protein ACYTFO_02175 [Planctomycetota bacterium]|jgi:hypothetical protein